MTMASFILGHLEPLLRDWDQFAGTLSPAKQLGPPILRDNAEAILRWVAEDMQTPQSPRERKAKSRGKRVRRAGNGDDAARVHAVDRHAVGFNLDQLLAEYRALRASVIRHWTDPIPAADRVQLDELIRFNEAIDEALVESAARYAAILEHSRELLLAALGHDLRSPLSGIVLSASQLLLSGALNEAELAGVNRILKNSARMGELIAGLLDFTQTRLGGSLPIVPRAMDMATACREAAQEIEALYPAELRVELPDTLGGVWDRARIGQLLANLLANAFQHGARDRPVTLSAHVEDTAAVIAVHNEGPAIDASARTHLFEPLVRGAGENSDVGAQRSFGLGLYIAREIVRAHRGTIEVSSSDAGGTTFTVRLPRSLSEGPAEADEYLVL